MKKLNIFIILLIILASSPFAFLGHELWHLGFGAVIGAKPVALCVNFGDSDRFASVLSSYNTTRVFDCSQCRLRWIDEVVAYIITIAVLFLGIFLLSKIYGQLLKEAPK